MRSAALKEHAWPNARNSACSFEPVTRSKFVAEKQKRFFGEFCDLDRAPAAEPMPIRNHRETPHGIEQPDPKSVMGWTSAQFAGALRHVESSPAYNPDFRQLLHVGFKVAAGMGKRFTDALKANEEIVGRNVTQNLFERHLKPIFA